MVWTLTGEPSAQLFEAGQALHWALQVPAAFAVTRLPARADDAHTHFRWRAALGALCSGADPSGYRAGLRFHDLTLLLFKDEALHSKYPLARKTLSEGYEWLETTLSNAGGCTVQLQRPDYDLPPHAVAAGAAFRMNELYKELAKWFANAATVLEEVRVAHRKTALDGALPVRCRPQSFAIATRLELDRKSPYAADEARSIGVGMLPGDADIAEPYWYVTPWPVPLELPLSALTSGRWHSDGWTGAVLPASDSTDSADAQAAQVEAFFRAAVAASRALLEGSSESEK